MQRPNIPVNYTYYTPRGRIYATAYATPETYSYSNQVLHIPQQQSVVGQRMPFQPGMNYGWRFPHYQASAFTHPTATQTQANPAPQKKVLDIINPNTGEKVDLSNVSSNQKNDSDKEQIRAQFASKVAAVASPWRQDRMEACEEEMDHFVENGMAEDEMKQQESLMSDKEEDEEEEVVDAEKSPAAKDAETAILANHVRVDETPIDAESENPVIEDVVMQKPVESKPPVRDGEPIREVEPTADDLKTNESDSEWKETKRSKKKKKAAKVEQHQQQPPLPPKGSSRPPPTRQQKPQNPVNDTPAPIIAANHQAEPVREALVKETQAKETKPRVQPVPVEPVKVWPSVKSQLVPSNQAQLSAKPPQPPPQPQQQVQQQKQHQQKQQTSKQQVQQLGKQSNQPPSKQQPTSLPGKQQCVVVATSKNEESSKTSNKKKSKEKNKNKKIAETPKVSVIPDETSPVEILTVAQEKVVTDEPVKEVPSLPALIDEVESTHMDVKVEVFEQVPVAVEEEPLLSTEEQPPLELLPVVQLESTVLPASEAPAPASVEEVVETHVVQEVSMPQEEEVITSEEVVEKPEVPVYVKIPSEELRAEVQVVEEYNHVAENKKEEEDDGRESDDTDLKFSYSDGQWSPTNPEGVKRYDRDFLLQVQQSIKMLKPTLPDLDIVLDEPHMKQMTSRVPSMSVNYGNYGRQNSNPYNRGKNQGQNRSGFEGRKIIDLRLQENVVLHRSGDAWQSMKKQDRSDIDLLLNKLRGILNKITPQCFNTLIEQVKQLSIDSVDKLSGCIDLLFEQCVKQPIFSGLYARMASCFSPLSVPFDDDPSKTVTFRKLLLTKCQQEFEQDKENEKEVMKISEKIENAQSDEEKKQLEDSKAEAMVGFKRRSLGNIKFIGELFKLSILTENIMHECLVKLLRGYEDEDNLECLCKLLTTIGKNIDDTKLKMQQRVDTYFVELKRIVDSQMTSTRIRFMIMDVTDLRKGGWVPKRNEGPKTIDQIHREAEEEKMVVQKKMDDSNRGQKRQLPRYNNPVSDAAKVADGWTNVTRLQKSQAFDANKLKLTKLDDNIQLGPGRSAWNKGSTGGVSKEQPMVPSNRYQLLSISADESSISYGDAGVSTSREKERYTGRLSGQPLKPERRSTEEKTAKVSAVPAKESKDLEISKEDIKLKVKSRIEEYLHLKDIKEAMETMKELNTASCFKNAVWFFYYSIEQNIEKSPKIMGEVGVFHQHVLKSGLAPVSAYAAALKKLTRLADDLAIDVPQVWSYLGEMVAPVFLQGSCFKLPVLLPESDGDAAADSDDELESEESDNTAKLFAMVLNAVSHKMGHHHASELWESSGLKWEDFVKNQPVKEFLKKFNVEYTVESAETGRRRIRLISVNENKNELIALFSKPDTTVENIHDWIYENMFLLTQDTGNPADLKSVSDCCTALCMSCLLKRHNSPNNEYDLDEERMKQFLCVIRSLTVERQERQLEVLFGLQELFHRLSYPSGLLHRLFELLFDAEVLNEFAFHQWREDTIRTVGKGVAMSSVSRFYNWIVEEDKDEHEEN